jgi:hypothetical protein
MKWSFLVVSLLFSLSAHAGYRICSSVNQSIQYTASWVERGTAVPFNSGTERWSVRGEDAQGSFNDKARSDFGKSWEVSSGGLTYRHLLYSAAANVQDKKGIYGPFEGFMICEESVYQGPPIPQPTGR